MNQPFNIDWQQLRVLLGDLQMVCYNAPDNSHKAELELTKLIYLIEKDLTEIKSNLGLPLLNPDICSASVVDNFKQAKDHIRITNEGKITFNEYFRQNDFQYWLLPFLLIRNNQIRSEHLTLYKIIDQFIDRVKDQSFSPGDIELTGSGATRCKTNLRFAFNDLKELGLVYLYDKKQKNSWTLTFIGFFAAASFCFKPVDEHYSPLGRYITRFHQSTYYYQINKYILDRIQELSDPEYFRFIVQRLKLESLKLKELERGPEIFKAYYESVTGIFENERNAEKRTNKLAEFLEDLNKRYPLGEYMDVLSSKFAAEEFFEEVTRGLRGN